MILKPIIMEYNDKNGFQSFLNVCDFSVQRAAPFGLV